jgi:hypothetical protein
MLRRNHFLYRKDGMAGVLKGYNTKKLTVDLFCHPYYCFTKIYETLSFKLDLCIVNTCNRSFDEIMQLLELY